jgi:hypothetical protein
MAHDSQPMHEPVVAWLRSFGDPLRNTKSAAQWIASLPTTDAMAIQKEALELVSKFPGNRRMAGPAQAEALLRIDARLEPILSQLSQQYTTNYQKSTGGDAPVASLDLVKARCDLRKRAARGISARRDRWRDLLLDPAAPRSLQRAPTQFRPPATASGSSAMARGYKQFADATGEREELAHGAGMFSNAGTSVEQEYLKSPLLMRPIRAITPDQVEWVAANRRVVRNADARVSPGPAGVQHVSTRQGLRRQERPPPGAACCFSTRGHLR